MSLVQSIYDIIQLLKKYGTFIYTGNRRGDLELIQLELEELFEAGFIQINEYQTAKLLIRKEINLLRKKD